MAGERSWRKGGVTPPTQRRSQETFDRIVAATEELLDGRNFSEIAVLEICVAADVSVSSFYARFEGKDSLLALMHERHLAERRAMIDRAAAELAGSDLPVRTLVHLAMELYASRHVAEGPLIGTLRRAEIDVPALADKRRQLDSYGVEVVAESLMRRLGTEDSAMRKRILFATRSMCAALQEAIHPPFAFADDLVIDQPTTLRHATEMWMLYVFEGTPPVEASPD